MKQLRIHNLSKKFDQQIIFENTSFDFTQGQIYGLLGRNGSGKSTLFNLIAHNLPMDSGEILVDDEKSLTADYSDLAVEMVYTQPHLPSFMTGREFVNYFTQINRDRLLEVHSSQNVADYLNLAGLSEKDANKLLRDYSQGMLNKLQLVVALMLKSPVILLDEPLTTVDVVAAHEIQQLIVEMKRESVLIFSTHIMQLAQDICDQVVLLHNHKLNKMEGIDIHSQAFEDAVIDALVEDDE